MWRLRLSDGRQLRVTWESGAYTHPSWLGNDRILANRWDPALGKPHTIAGASDSWELVELELGGKASVRVLPAGSQLIWGSDRNGGRFSILRWDGGGSDQQALPAAGEEASGEIRRAGSGRNEEPIPFVIRVPDGAERGDVDVFPSPDLEHAAVLYRHNIYLMKLDASHDREIVVDLNDSAGLIRLSEHGAEFPRWSTNVSLVFVAANRLVRYDVKTGEKRVTPIDITLRRHVGRGVVALRGARLVTMDPSLGVVEYGDIVVSDGRIDCVGECDLGHAETVLDVSGHTIIPGLIDAHAHDDLDPGGFVYQHVRYPAAYLAYGVTTMIDPAGLTEQLPIGELIAAGRLRGARYFSVGGVLATPDRHTTDELRREVYRRVDRGAAGIKMIMELSGRRARQAIVDAARQREITVTAHIQDLNDMVSQILDGVTGMEHWLDLAPFYDDAVQLMAASGFVYSTQTARTDFRAGRATEYWLSQQDMRDESRFARFMPWQAVETRRLFSRKPASEYAFPIFATTAADIAKAGGYVPLGSHSMAPGIDYHWELWANAYGRSPAEILESATMHGAYYYGLDDDLGSLSAGKIADLVVLTANPLDDIRNSTAIRYVMKDGRLYDSMTLDEVWPTRDAYGRRLWSN